MAPKEDQEPVAVVDDHEEDNDDEGFEDGPAGVEKGSGLAPADVDEDEEEEDEGDDEVYDSEDDEDEGYASAGNDDEEDEDEDDDDEDGPAAAAGQRQDHTKVLSDFYNADDKVLEGDEEDDDYSENFVLADGAKDGAKRKAEDEDVGADAKKAKAA